MSAIASKISNKEVVFTGFADHNGINCITVILDGKDVALPHDNRYPDANWIFVYGDGSFSGRFDSYEVWRKQITDSIVFHDVGRIVWEDRIEWEQGKQPVPNVIGDMLENLFGRS